MELASLSPLASASQPQCSLGPSAPCEEKDRHSLSIVLDKKKFTKIPSLELDNHKTWWTRWGCSPWFGSSSAAAALRACVSPRRKHIVIGVYHRRGHRGICRPCTYIIGIHYLLLFFMQMKFWGELSHRSLLACEVVADSLDESTNENISILSIFLMEGRGWICIFWWMSTGIMPSCITSNVMGLG